MSAGVAGLVLKVGVSQAGNHDNRGHGFGSEPYMVRRRWDYFVRHLLGAEPPKEYQIKRPVHGGVGTRGSARWVYTARRAPVLSCGKKRELYKGVSITSPIRL